MPTELGGSAIHQKLETGNPMSAKLASSVDQATPKVRPDLGLLDFVGRFGLAVAWLIVIAAFGVLSPAGFLSASNFASMFGSQAVLVVLACGLLFPLRAGDYDLSISGTMALSSMTIAVMNVNLGIDIGWCILVVLAIGLVVGLLNGLISTSFNIDPFIVTLGLGTFLNGLALWVSDSQTISGVSKTLVSAVVGTRLLGISVEFYYGIAFILATVYLFEFTSLGRRLLFVGKGRDVARLSGIPVDRIRIGAFVVSGMIAAIAGILYVGTFGGADPASAQSYLMPAFAAAFLGSTTIKPGFFNPLGTVIAVYFLQTGISGLAIMGIPSYVQNLFYGAALIIAVVLSQLAKRSVVNR